MTKRILAVVGIALVGLGIAFVLRDFFSTNGMPTPKLLNQPELGAAEAVLKTNDANEAADFPIAGAEDTLGRITRVYPCQEGRICIDADYVEWLTDKDAIRAALEDNGCGYGVQEIPALLAKLDEFDISQGYDLYGACAPNGYYVRNPNPQIRTLVFDQYAAKITYGSYECFPGDSDSLCFIDLSPAQFSKVYNGTLTPPLGSFVGGFRDALYNIKIENGAVVSLIQQYQP